MRTLKILGLGVVVAIASSAASAFQEQKVGGSAPGVSAPADAAAEKSLGVTTEGTAPKSAVGTEVRIPGLGKLGVLPKMDFGLELLYGAADPGKQPEARSSTPNNDQDDLTIRGTLKHRW